MGDATMRAMLWLLSAMAAETCIGCDIVVEDKAAAAVAKLSAGMTEAEVMELMKPVSIEFGTTYWGGSGRHTVYFALPGDRQIGVHMGPGPSGDVERIDPISTKRTWIRNENGSISVE